jgi:hypothetical protein
MKCAVHEGMTSPTNGPSKYGSPVAFLVIVGANNL